MLLPADVKPCNATGRLQILSHPDTYTARLQRESKLFNERQRHALQEQEMKDYAECTFQPETHDAPSYIKRIAKSMALTRQAREKAGVAAGGRDAHRPDWR